jgi:hypothetical protein
MAKNFISGAIKHPGVFSAAAKSAGMSTREYALAHQNDSGTTGNRARFALTLMKLSKKRGSASRRRGR